MGERERLAAVCRDLVTVMRKHSSRKRAKWLVMEALRAYLRGERHHGHRSEAQCVFAALGHACKVGPGFRRAGKRWEKWADKALADI